MASRPVGESQIRHLPPTLLQLRCLTVREDLALSPSLITENAVVSDDKPEICTATRHATEFCDNNTTKSVRDFGEDERERMKRDGVVCGGGMHDQMWYGGEGEDDEA